MEAVCVNIQLALHQNQVSNGFNTRRRIWRWKRK